MYEIGEVTREGEGVLSTSLRCAPEFRMHSQKNARVHHTVCTATKW